MTMLFLVCLLFCTSIAYGMDGQNNIKKFVKEKNEAWKKEQKNLEKLRKRREKDAETRRKTAELERKKQEKLKQKERQKKAEQDYQRMLINAGATKAVTKTMGWSFRKKRARPGIPYAELPDDKEGKTKTL